MKLLVFICIFVLSGIVFADEKLDELFQDANEHFQSGNLQEAIKISEKAFSYAKEKLGKQQPKTLTSADILASLYRLHGDFGRAKDLYVETLSLRKQLLGGKHPDTLISMRHLADLYYSQGRYQLAEDLYAEALALKKEVLGDKHPSTLRSMRNLALVYEANGRYRLAEDVLVEALAFSREELGGRHPDTLTTMHNLASSYSLQGRYKLAIDLQIETLNMTKETLGERHPDTLTTMHNLASSYSLQGRYKLAEDLYVETISLRKEVLGDRHRDTLISIHDLAGLYYSQGRYQLAEDLYVEALALKREVLGDKHPSTLRSMRNLALVYEANSQYRLAENLLVEALAFSREVLGDKHPDTLFNITNLALIYWKRGLYDEAEDLNTVALKLLKEILGDKHPSTLFIMHNLALVYHSKGQFRLAEDLYAETLSSRKEVLGESHPDIFSTMNNLSMLYFETEQYDKAEQLFSEMQSGTQSFLSQNLWAAGELTRVSYIQQRRYEIDYYLTLFNHRANSANAQRALTLSLNRKGLLLQIASQISALTQSSDDPALNQLVKSLNDNRQYLSSLMLSGKANTDEYIILEEKVNQQQSKLADQVQRLGRSSRQVSPEQVVQALGNKAAFVDFLIYRPYTPKHDQGWQKEHLLALVVTNEQNNPIHLVSLGELTPIQQTITAYRKALSRAFRLSRKDKSRGLSLYQSLWSPLLPYLKEKEKIYLAPDGILNLLPFGSLINPAGKYLLEEAEIIMLSSGRDLVLPALKGELTRPVILAGPLYDSSQAKLYAASTIGRSSLTAVRSFGDLYFNPLPEALVEGEIIHTLLEQSLQPSSMYKLASATEPNVKALRSPRFLHMATHAFYLEDLPRTAINDASGPVNGLNTFNPGRTKKLPIMADVSNPLLRSGLALVDANLAVKSADDEKDGVLTAEEVINLQLAGTELVVLSACDTGVGEIQTGEGVYGLRRAFQEAGAKTVLSTLWSIGDESTRHLMDRFYQLFLKGMPSQQALREVQLGFINSAKWNHPFYWAPYVMVGK